MDIHNKFAQKKNRVIKYLTERCVCNKVETIDHIFFQCVFAQYVWCCIGEAFGLRGLPLSVEDLLSRWLSKRLGLSKRLCLMLFAGIAQALWLNRNKMAIEKRFPNSPDVVLRMILNFVQIWAELLKETDRAKMRDPYLIG